MPVPTRLTGSLLPLARNWRRAVDRALSPYTLSESCGLPLIYLGRSGGGISQSQLADLSGIGGPSLVRIIDKLVAGDLVLRVVDDHDKRLRRLWLTPQGQALAKDMERSLDAMRAEVLADISEADLATALRVITRINSAITGPRSV